jgi:hypothetical protein
MAPKGCSHLRTFLFYLFCVLGGVGGRGEGVDERVSWVLLTKSGLYSLLELFELFELFVVQIIFI